MTTQVSDRPAVTQDRVIVLKSAEETAGELFRCEYIARVVSPRRGIIYTRIRRSGWRSSRALCDVASRARSTCWSGGA